MQEKKRQMKREARRRHKEAAKRLKNGGGGMPTFNSGPAGLPVTALPPCPSGRRLPRAKSLIVALVVAQERTPPSSAELRYNAEVEAKEHAIMLRSLKPIVGPRPPTPLADIEVNNGSELPALTLRPAGGTIQAPAFLLSLHPIGWAECLHWRGVLPEAFRALPASGLSIPTYASQCGSPSLEEGPN